MWHLVCCEVQGAGHEKARIPCQDKTYSCVENGAAVIALADGAGSASLSHYGAERVVRDAAKYIAGHFLRLMRCEDGRVVKRELLEMLRAGLSEEAQKRRCSTGDLASTLLLAAVRGEDFFLLHIGDGIIGYLDGEELKAASLPDNGEFSNVTTFVTSGGAAASMRLFKGKLKEKSAFVLMSDGTGQSLYHKTEQRLAGAVKKLMHRACLTDSGVMGAQLREAFRSVVARNTRDDCSIAILARPSRALCPVEAMGWAERRDLYGISPSGRCVRRRVCRYDTILALAGEPRPAAQIARAIRLRPKYAKRQLERLVSLGLLQKRRGLYRKTPM